MNYKASNVWTASGVVLIVCGTIGTILVNFIGVSGRLLVGSVMDSVVSLPVYVVFAGIGCMIIGYLKEILYRLNMINSAQERQFLPPEYTEDE